MGDTAELRVGDSLRTVEGRDVPIEGITDTGEEAVVYQMDAAGAEKVAGTVDITHSY